MKSKILIFSIAVLLISCFSTVSFEAEKADKPQLNIVWDILVKPSMVGTFEAAAKEEKALYAKYEFPYSWDAYSTHDFHYYYVMKVDNFTAMDELYKAFGEIKKKMGDQYQVLMDRYAGTFEFAQSGIYKHLPELSYMPENPRLKKEEMKFLRWSFLYIKGGKEKGVEEIAKRWASLSKNKNIAESYFFYAASMGAEMPLYVVVEGGKSASDFFTQKEKHKELMGEEGMQLWKEAMSTMRRMEEKIGWSRPDLSYTPEEKKNSNSLLEIEKAEEIRSKD
jgi:hypothetical protein